MFKMKIYNSAVLVFSLIFITSGILFGGDTGKISGTVVDGANNKPLIGADVTIVGTYLGAATDDDGEYDILQVPPGIYEVSVKYYGYAKLTTSNVRVVTDLTTKLDFKAIAQVEEGQEVTIVAEKPLFERSATNEVRVVRGEQIQNMPVRGYNNIAALQTGVVVDDDEDLHVRGGRRDETAYYIDGVYVNSPYDLSRAGEVPNMALEEVAMQIGGFGAEYGDATSGIVNITTKTGGDKIEFSSEAITDGFLPSDPSVEKPLAFSYGYNLFSGTASGPIPIANFLKFHGALESLEMSDADPTNSYFPVYVGPINPANGLPDNGEPFVDSNGNTFYDIGEDFTDTNGNGVFDKYDYLNIDPEDIEFRYGPKYDNWTKRLTLSGNVSVDLKSLVGLSWNLKLGGSYNDHERSHYFIDRSLFDFYNTASTENSVGTTGSLKRRYRVSSNQTSTLYARLRGNIPTIEKMFFTFQISKFSDNYLTHDPVFSESHGNIVFEDKTVSDFTVPFVQTGKKEDISNPVWYYWDRDWVFEDSEGNEILFDYMPDTSLTFLRVDSTEHQSDYWMYADTQYVFHELMYDTAWVNPLYVQTGVRPTTDVEWSSFNQAGYSYTNYEKESTEHLTYKGALTWQLGDHEIKSGFEYRDNTVRYYRMARPTSLAAYFNNNKPYGPDQDTYRWDALNNDIIRGYNGLWDSDELFTDENPNGQWDEGEEWVDLDTNGVWDIGEEYFDTGNGTWDLGETWIDLPPDGILDYLQELNDTWDGTDVNGDGQIDYQDYYQDLLFQGFKASYAENIGYDITGQKEVNSGNDKARKPVMSALFIQDKFELNDLIMTLGLRYDYIDPNNTPFNPLTGGNENIVITDAGTLAQTVYWVDEDFDGEIDPFEYTSSVPTEGDSVGLPHMVPSKIHKQFSPRIGMAFPVTDRTVFHVQYGKYMQQPEMNRMFLSYTRFLSNLEQGNFTISQNPALEPVKTTSYEIGFKQLLSPDISIDATIFYKQTDGYVQIRNIEAKPTGYALYVNGDYGTVKGLSLSFNTRRLNNYRVSANYTLQYAGGTGSNSTRQYTIAWLGGNFPTYVSPTEYDQRHTGNVTFDYRTGDGRGVFNNFGVNVLFQFGSGLRYTPSEPRSEIFGGSLSYNPTAALNSGTMPRTFQLDMKIDKSFKLGPTSLNAFLWIENVLDRQNTRSVYNSTGLPYTDGHLTTTAGQNWLNNVAVGGPEFGNKIYEAHVGEPSNYGKPRQIRFGLRLNL
tara:strand:- start:3395 stop:7120 length:3726 start_codon:yes stop_codon:yes gene_type:complete